MLSSSGLSVLWSTMLMSPHAAGFNLMAQAELVNAWWERGVRIAIIITVSLLAARLLVFFIGRLKRILAATAPEESEKRIATVVAILRNVTNVTIIVVTLFEVFSELGINVGPLVAGAGIAGVVFGFGAQSLVKDLFYGGFILLENQFAIGDVISIGPTTGTLERMTLRVLHLRDVEGRLHIIPNGEASRVVVHSRGWSAMNLNLELALDTDVDKALTVLDTVNQTIAGSYPHLLLEPPRTLGVEALGANGVVIKVMAKTLPQKQWELSRHYRKAAKAALDAAQIQFNAPAPPTSPTTAA